MKALLIAVILMPLLANASPIYVRVAEAAAEYFPELKNPGDQALRENADCRLMVRMDASGVSFSLRNLQTAESAASYFDHYISNATQEWTDENGRLHTTYSNYWWVPGRFSIETGEYWDGEKYSESAVYLKKDGGEIAIAVSRILDYEPIFVSCTFAAGPR